MEPTPVIPSINFTAIGRLVSHGTFRPIPLADRSVHVWGVLLESDTATVDRCRSWLSADERERGARCMRTDHQIQYVLARGGLRVLLAHYLGTDPAALRFHNGPRGKPSLLGEAGHAHVLRFNLSHSSGRMLIAVARNREVGIDLEVVRETIEVAKLAARFYTPEERRRVQALSGSDQAQEFYRYWVAKESVLKGQGVGLAALQHCAIAPSGNSLEATARITPGSGLDSGWRIRWVDCGVQWNGAVASSGDDWRIEVLSA